MIELAGLTEIKINTPNLFGYLQKLQSKIETSEDPKEKMSLAIQCAEKVLFMWEEEFPNDKRPRKAIEAAKVYLADPTEENKKAAKVASDAASAAADAASFDDLFSSTTSAAANAAFAASNSNTLYSTSATYAADQAIKATKTYYKLNEIRVNQPNNLDNLPWTKELYDFFKTDQSIFKNSGIDSIIRNNISKILDNTWERYLDVYQEFDVEEHDGGYLTDYPKIKADLFNPDKQTSGSNDAEYFEASEFLFPYILKHLKENGWEHVVVNDWISNKFTKDGREVDIFDYIKPFVDQDSDPRDGLYERFVDYIEENY